MGRRGENDLLTQRVIGFAIDVHRQLGPGLLESAYEECLCFELKHNRLPFKRQVPLPVVGGLIAHCLAVSLVKLREDASDGREDQISIAILPAGAQFQEQIKVPPDPRSRPAAAAFQDDGGAHGEYQ